MSTFGKWYEDQQQPPAESSSWSDQSLPLFNTENFSVSFDSMRQSMEASMPKKILGMGYQQRFKVSHGTFSSTKTIK